MKLIHTKTKLAVNLGDVVKNEGKLYTVCGWQEPRSAASSGRVSCVRGRKDVKAAVKIYNTGTGYETYYACVWGMEFIDREDRQLAKVKSLGELRQLALEDSRYLQLAIISAENLGGKVRLPKEDAQPGDTSYEVALGDAMKWLNTNANETDERGVVQEVNACRDLVK